MSDPPRPSAGARRRLDAELVARGIAESRAKAHGLILSGRVLLAGVVCTKCGTPVKEGADVGLLPAPRPFASRGGGKLSGALDDFGIDPAGSVALDVGASTGGFTDCLLRRGASRVYALDVGERLLDDRLLRDPRVVSIEKVNFRHAAGDLLPEKVTLAVVDVSFISLRHILPTLPRFLAPGAEALPLVKPQFEVGKGRVGKGGVVRDDTLRREAVDGIAAFARETGYEVLGEAESRVPGPKGNREVFLYLRWAGDTPSRGDIPGSDREEGKECPPLRPGMSPWSLKAPAPCDAGLWVVGEGHSSNRSTDNLQECPSKAPAPYSDFFMPYFPLYTSLVGWCERSP